MYTTLLLYLQIQNTQKWAGGHAVPSRYVAYICSHKNYLGNTLFPRYYITPHSSLKWMNNAALEEATNRGVLVNTSQVGNF